ncbi:MAG TPA: TlpA disulfide reductase family protein [Pyrinomonadaceae bacterium]|nr:TlpA disulfide reductase family protein [Pyrinomonadaceae bacterium]
MLLKLSATLLLLPALAASAQTPAPREPPAPRTPAEAYRRASEPTRKQHPSLEENVAAWEEQGRRAREFAALFRAEDWRGEELYHLGKLYAAAGQHALTERALKTYLRRPSAARAADARTALLYALAAQKKWDDAVAVAEVLLNKSPMSYDVLYNTQNLINSLREADAKRAVAFAAKRQPKLMRYALGQTNNPAVGSLLDFALGLGELYKAAGDAARAEAFVRSFREEFERSPLGAKQELRGRVEAAVLRINLIAEEAPRLAGGETIGELPRLDSLKGKVVVLEFFAHWCPPCVASIPALNRLKEKYEPRGLALITVTSYYGYFGEREKLGPAEERAALEDLWRQREARFGLLVGPDENFKAYGVRGLPVTVFIDRAGKVRSIKSGYGIDEHTERYVESLLAEPAPPR